MLDSSINLQQKRILIVFLLLAFFLSALLFSSRLLEHKFKFSSPEFLYAPPLEYLELISGSFRIFFADIFYIKGIMAVTQYYHEPLAWVDWVQKNFDLATSLDPKMTQAYFFGGVVITHNKEAIMKGISFLKKGLERSPQDWQISYWIGFNYYQLQDYLNAVEYFGRASRIPGAPDFLASILPMFYYRSGRADLGIAYLKGLLESVKEDRQMEWIKIKLEWLSQIAELEANVNSFRRIYNYCPSGLEELVEKGLIKNIPQSVFGGDYYLDKQDCRVKSGVNSTSGKFANGKEGCSTCAQEKR